MHGNNRHRGKSCGIVSEHVDRHLIVGTGGGPAQVILSNTVECEPKARIDQREVDAQLRQSFVQQSRQQRSGLVEGLAGDAPPVASPGAIVLTLRPGGAVPHVIALPERSHPVDRLSAAHFTQVLEKDRHRFQPVAVTVDHRMFQAGVYFSGAIFHRHESSRLFAFFIIASSPSRQTT
jgi:hypothetical protein